MYIFYECIVWCVYLLVCVLETALYLPTCGAEQVRQNGGQVREALALRQA